MADNSLITKNHLRNAVEGMLGKLNDSDTASEAAITAHNTNSDAHADIRQAIEDAMYTHPSYTARSSGLYKITVDDKGHVSAVTAVTKDDITALGIPGEDTNTVYTHPSYTARNSGLYKITVDDKGHVNTATAVTKADITALGIPAQDTDTVYTHPSYNAKSSGLYKITVDATGHVSAVTAVTKADITALGIPGEDTNTTYSDATTSAAGLMSAADKSKLDGIEAGATAGGSGNGVPVVTAASSDGVAYTATVDGVDALSAGQLIVFIPAMTSASTAPTLNINGLGAKTIKRRLSSLSSTTASGLSNNWLFLNKPQLLMYDGTYWIVANQDKPQAGDLYGNMAVSQLTASSDNEGQFLRVVSGVPTWTTIPSGEEASF